MVIQILSVVIGVNQLEIHKYLVEKYVTPCYGARTGDPKYDPRVDLDKNGVIDGKDIALFAKDAGLTFKTFGVTPLLWYHVAVPLGLGFVGVVALVLLRKR